MAGSSKRWLARQHADPYVERAKREGWRSRAAFKLIELDGRFRLLRKGARVVDLGAAPGGWTQVAARAVGEGGRVVALDQVAMHKVPGAIVLTLDFLAPEAPAALHAALGGKANLVLSDLAPATSGHRETDHLRSLALAEAAFAFACEVLAPGGAFVTKLFQGGGEPGFVAALGARFAQVRRAKPAASRGESVELFVVATGFRPDHGAA